MALQLPPDHGSLRDLTILEYVRNGQYEADLFPIVAKTNGKEVKFWVFRDAMKIDGVRINVSAKVQQTIADMIGCSLLTPRMADLLWINRNVTLAPSPQPISSLTQAMIAHSARIDAKLSKLKDTSGIIQTVGKHWVIDNDILLHPGRAENYGWHFQEGDWTGPKEPSASKDSSGAYIRMIQGRGWAHDMSHVDYSQICVLASNYVEVDGEPSTLENVLTNPDLASALSHQGVMKVLRQPGVPKADVTSILTPTINVIGSLDTDPVENTLLE